jgi:hypothetical protein
MRNLRHGQRRAENALVFRGQLFFWPMQSSAFPGLQVLPSGVLPFTDFPFRNSSAHSRAHLRYDGAPSA